MAISGFIPFNDLSRSVSELKTEINLAINEVLKSGWFVMGPQQEALENELAEFLGVKYAISVGNGTDALEISLSALGVKQGSKVLTVANAGAYTSTATLALGAEPIYVDVDPLSLLMTPATLHSALEKLDCFPDAIVVTHLYGSMAPMPEIMLLAKERGIPVVEDCAQSLGASLDGTQSGAFGDISTTSFYPTKNLGALGDGGAIFTNNEHLASKVKKIRQYGWDSKYSIQNLRGKNSRLDEIQAAILRVKLPILQSTNLTRKLIHETYESLEIPNAELVNKSNESFNGHLAVLRAENRNEFRQRMTDLGVSTEVHYPVPDHRQHFPEFVPREMPLEVTEWASEHIVSIPMFAELRKDEINHISLALSSG